MRTAAGLSDALTGQIAGGARHLTVDLSGLRFADSAAIRALVLAHRALEDRGGAVELLRPQPYRPGHGLWLVRQAASRLSVSTGSAGSRVTAVFTVPAAPASS